MSVPVHQVGAIGTVFVFTVRDQAGAIVDLSTATKLDAKFRAGPKGATKTFSLPDTALLTDGTDGKFFYATAAVGDLDVAHDCWQRQGDVDVPGLYTGGTEVRTFAVKPNL
jgi:hypothetical protein